MHLSDKVKLKITKALGELPNEEMEILPDYEFWPVLVPMADGGQGIHMMVVLFVPVSDKDYAAPMLDIDPYASQGDFNALILRLYENGSESRNASRLAVAPGLVQPGARRSQSGLVLPD